MNNTPWTFSIVTFGCKVNQYESQSIREAWSNLHGEEVATPQTADIILLNTCAITANAITDARQLINKLHREAPNSKIILTGCATDLTNEALYKLPGVYTFISQKNKTQLLSNLPLTQLNQDQLQTNTNTFPQFSISNFNRSRPIVKVQDGCSHSCTYCIIPSTRGKPKSRSPKECLIEIQQLLNAGFREIILSGINLRQYTATQQGCKDFWELYSFLDKKLSPTWKGIARLRISSLDPAQLTQRGLDILSNSHMGCQQLHLSIQSGSAEILKKMHRSHYTPQYLLDTTKKLSTIWHKFGLGADFIIGFPGETEKHFQETVDLIKELPLTYGHIFPFSARPNTIAATLPNHIKKSESQQRAATIRQLITQKEKIFHKQLLTMSTLHIAPEGGGKTGGVDEYYTHCHLTEPVETHQLLKVKPLSLTKKGLLVEILPPH